MSSLLAALRPDNDNHGRRQVANDHKRSAIVSPPIAPSVPAVPVALRHAFTRLAAGEVAMLGPIRETVAIRKAALRALLSTDLAPAAMQHAATRFADDLITGAFRTARARTTLHAHSMIAPLSVAAVGNYGRETLLPTERPELLILVVAGLGRAAPTIVEEGLGLLRTLTFDVDHAVVMLETARTPRQGLDLRLRTSRLLWGRTDLYATLRGDQAG